jgi:hypothetical protein
MKNRLIIFLMLITICQGIHAQYYDTGQDPSFIKWLQIKTNRFTLIYPESYGQEGVKFAKSLDESFAKLNSLFPENKVRIPIIIHNYTTFSNGYVAWAPKRMEIYPTPEEDGIPLDTKEQLTTHELTHVLQLSSLDKGFTRVMSVITGEQFKGAVSAFLPLWFMEGDAVFAESLLSLSGRGKTASFQKEMKAIALEKPKMYSYDKMVAGSFQTMIPDQYHYGYQMVAWSFVKYNSRLWNKTLDFTAKYPFTLNPVNYSLRENAGLTKSKLFYETFDSLKVIWQHEMGKINPVIYTPLNADKKKEYVNYYSPVIVGKDSVVSIKTTLSSTPEFVLINLKDNTEKRIFTPGTMYPYFLSGSDGKIVWVEERPDPRWENRNYNVIMIMDLHTRIARQLSFRSRYLAASVSKDGMFIAAVENTIKNENSLVIINAVNGDILNKIPIPGNAFAQRPQWSQSGEEITIISLSEKGEGVLSYYLKINVWNTLISPGRNDLQSAFLRHDSLIFGSSSSGIDNLYILTPEKKIVKLTNSRYGAYDPYPSGGNIIFSDYSVSGNNICITKISESQLYTNKDEKDPSFLINRFDTIRIKSSDLGLSDYKPVPYRKLGHIFGFHSWMPFYADLEKIKADPATVRPGLTVMSQNQLSTVISTIGYEYASDKTNRIHTKVTLKGWFPVIESQLDYGGNAAITKTKETDPDPAQIVPELSFTNTIYIPLTFSAGRFGQYFQPSFSSTYFNRYVYRSELKVYDYGQTELTGRFYFMNYQSQSIRDLYPRWAQVFDYSYSFFPDDKVLYGDISTLKSAFFFPGILRNHSLKFRFEDEVQKPVKFILPNRASFPRGYHNIISQKLRLYSADYTLPLAYPDMNIPWVFYLKRIRGGFFYDYAEGTKNSYFLSNGTRVDHAYTETFRSFGGTLLADFYILRIPFMISAGVQSTWKNPNELPVLELLFNVDLFGMKIGQSRM